MITQTILLPRVHSKIRLDKIPTRRSIQQHTIQSPSAETLQENPAMLCQVRLCTFFPVPICPIIYTRRTNKPNRGNIGPLEQICLPPLVKKLKQRVAARGGKLNMSWHLHKVKSMRVVSHRAAPLGEEQPDSAYRQVVVRIESVQSLKRSDSSSSSKSAKSSSSPRAVAPPLPWVPDAVRQRTEKARQRIQKLEDEGENVNQIVKSGDKYADNGVPKTVVEYLVLQKRVVRGVEEDWKVWGFAKESTPSVVASDEKYWAKMLDTQLGPA